MSLHPHLWGLGTLTLCAALMVLRLAWARWPRGVAINTVVCGWLLIAVVQAITSTIHGLSSATSWPSCQMSAPSQSSAGGSVP